MNQISETSSTIFVPDLARLCRENGFSIKEYDLSDQRGRYLVLQHSSGAKLYIAGGDTEESAFSYCFATPSANDKGLAHIVEHVVFCGSKNYPLKEPFANLQKHSLASFLNAMTYPDQTVYPAASAFVPDFLQLLKVYGDAVFFPLLEHEAIAQEGVRQSLAHQNGEENRHIELDGIVYNEMQGYYGDFDTYTADCSLRSLFFGKPAAQSGVATPIEGQTEPSAHSNSFDSGGRPQAIAAIDCRNYREVREFHQRYYRPQNCRIVMYGPIVQQHMEEILGYLGRELLHEAQQTDTSPVEIIEAPYSPTKLPKVQRLYEAVPVASPSRRSVMFSWVLPPQRNLRRSLEYRLMNELLLGHSGAILEQPIMKSTWGADIALGSGLELDLANPVLRIGLSGYKPKDGECLRKLIWDALECFCEQAENAKQNEELELLWQGALNSLEYEERSLWEHGGSEGICAIEYCLQMSRASLYYENIKGIFATLHPAMEELRSAGLAAFVPRLRRYTLENEHWTLQLFEEVTATPQKIVPALPLSDEELQSAQQAFAKYQARCDTPEDSQRIRSMGRSEFGRLTPLPACLHRFYPASAIEFFCTKGPKVAQTDQNLVQVNLYWEISHWKPEEAILLPLFLDLMAELGLPGQPFEKVARQKSLQIGSWEAEISLKPQFRKPDGSQTEVVRSFAHIQLHFLPREWRNGLALFWKLLCAGDWQNEDKLLELLQSRYYEKNAELTSSPLGYVVQRSCYRLSHEKQPNLAKELSKCSQAELAEWFYGLGQLELLSKLCAQPQKYLAPLVSSFIALRRRLLCDAPLSCAVAGPEYTGELAREIASAYAQKQASGKQTEKPGFWVGLAALPLCDKYAGELWHGNMALEHLCIALSVPLWPQNSENHLRPALEVLARLLQSGPAWEKIRLQQGAYGVRAMLKSDCFLLCSNEDPNAQNSIGLFRSAIEEIRNKASFAQQTNPKTEFPNEFEAEFEAAVVQILAERLKKPSAHQHAQIALHREKTGICHNDLSAWLEELRELQLDDICLAADYLLANWLNKAVCIFTGRQSTEQNAEVSRNWEHYELREYRVEYS